MYTNFQGRRPLSEVQKAGSTSVKDEMVGRQQVPAKKMGAKAPDSPNGTKNSLSKVKSGLVAKKKQLVKAMKHQEVQTDNGDFSVVTGEEAPLEYWKDLAETRRQALEEALEENQNLHRQVEELSKEKEFLDEMLEKTKQIAEMLEDLSDEENPDESGIGFSIKKEIDDSMLEKDTDSA